VGRFWDTVYNYIRGCSLLWMHACWLASCDDVARQLFVDFIPCSWCVIDDGCEMEWLECMEDCREWVEKLPLPVQDLGEEEVGLYIPLSIPKLFCPLKTTVPLAIYFVITRTLDCPYFGLRARRGKRQFQDILRMNGLLTWILFYRALYAMRCHPAFFTFTIHST